MADVPVPVFDGHNDCLLKLEIEGRHGRPLDFATGADVLDIDLPRARKGGFAGGFFALYTPSDMTSLTRGRRPDPRDTRPVGRDEALDFTLALFARLRRLVRALPDDLAICADAPQIRAAMAEGRIAVVPHLEGAEAIDEDFHALEVLHAAGLRSLGLVWSRPNRFGDGAPMRLQSRIEPGNGLTGAGRALVRACNRLGILVDCAHLTEAGFWDVAATTDRPLVASHSNAHAISPNARNLTDRQLDAIRESGGLVGVNFHVAFLRPDCRMRSDTGMDVVIRHLDHLLERLGEDGVALGSDFDGCELPQAIGDVTGLPRVVAAMRRAGYGEALVKRICAGNWLAQLDRL